MVDSPRQQQRRRNNPPAMSAWKKSLLGVLWVIGFAGVFVWQTGSPQGFRPPQQPVAAAEAVPVKLVEVLQPQGARMEFELTEFGAVGDGKMVNTKAFERAVAAIAGRGGGRLTVRQGRWLTAPFNLTSNMTLFLAKGAVILGIRDEKYWPLMPPLPSYGRGREADGLRYGSLIHGQNLTNVVITGENGSINGQGIYWWNKFRAKLLKHTRGPLVQLMWSKNIVISSVTLQDSPFWTVHLYDCDSVTVSNVMILAPTQEAPNTDGINPDSCTNVLIENCYISVGDDCIAIKSGWDQYGIAYARPSTNIVIRNVVLRSMVSAGVSIGSEMSGGVSDILVENVYIWDSRRGVRIKTAPGRGAYVRNISYRNVTLDNIRVGIVIWTMYNEHPDGKFDKEAFPIIENISFTSIYGRRVQVPVRIQGSPDIPIRAITFRNMSVGVTSTRHHLFQCSFVEGRVMGSVFPVPCRNLDLYNEHGELVRRSVSHNVSDIDYSLG